MAAPDEKHGLVSSENPHPNALERMVDAKRDTYLSEQYEQRQQAIAEAGNRQCIPSIGETLFLGHDTEFQECPDSPLHPLKLQSQQIHAIGIGGQMAATYIPPSDRHEDRVSLSVILDDLIPELLHRGIIINYPKHIVFVGFFDRVDLAMFSDFVHFREALSNVNGRLATTGKGLPRLVCERRSVERTMQARQWLADAGRVVMQVRITFYDVASHAPEKTPLHVLGGLIGIRKRKIKPPFHISRIAEYRRARFKEFLLYGMQDAQITITYYLRVLKFAKQELGGPRIANGLLPVSVGSLSVQIFKKELKASGLNYETVFGLRTVNQKPWNTPKHRYGYRSSTVKKTIRKVREAFAVDCYHGGRNECFYFGLTDLSRWFDLDLRGAYSIGLLIIRLMDYYNSYETRDIQAYTGDVMGFAEVEFSFPSDVRYPCLPVRTDKESLEFPRTGTSLCTAPELALAIRLGVEITHVEYGVIIPWVDGGPRIFESFVRKVRYLRSIHPKGSPDEQYAKLMGNSLYGKTGQGLHEKVAFDTQRMESKKIPESAISHGMIAAFVTGFVRAVMGEILNSVPANRRVICCVTDGILTDAPLDELDFSGPLARQYQALLELVES